jgi:hypothetical protein
VLCRAGAGIHYVLGPGKQGLTAPRLPLSHPLQNSAGCWWAPAGMWAKASISPLSHWESGEMQAFGLADCPHIHGARPDPYRAGAEGACPSVMPEPASAAKLRPEVGKGSCRRRAGRPVRPGRLALAEGVVPPGARLLPRAETSNRRAVDTKVSKGGCFERTGTTSARAFHWK